MTTWSNLPQTTKPGFEPDLAASKPKPETEPVSQAILANFKLEPDLNLGLTCSGYEALPEE